jgi:hypothetical protein
MAKKKKSAGFDLKPILIIIGILLLPLTIYIFYRITISHSRLLPISVISIILGAIIESKRLSDKWAEVFGIAIFSFIFSFLSFLPGDHETVYNFETHVKIWPYTFLFFFIIISIVINKEKVIPRLSEGITLIMSVAIIYWVLDHGYFNTSSVLLKTIMIIGFFVAGFSIVNAFLNIRLTKSLRLFLSIWTSIIMALLAIDNIYSVYQTGQIEDSVFSIDKVIIGLQYFLLGICSIYIVQNIMMILEFLPGKRRFFNKEYFKDLKVLKKDHINRYSENQSNILLSFICLILPGSFFILNNNLDLLPRNTAIWIVFLVFNRIVYYYDFIKIYR